MRTILAMIILVAGLAGGAYYFIKDLPLVKKVIAFGPVFEAKHPVGFMVATHGLEDISGNKSVEYHSIKEYHKDAVDVKFDLLVALGDPTEHSPDGATLTQYLEMKLRELTFFITTRYDHNGNGKVDKSEWLQEDQFRLSAVDKNDDNVVTVIEYWASYEDEARKAFRQADSNKDKTLSFKEFRNSLDGEQYAMDIDSNGNGGIDSEEMENALRDASGSWVPQPY